MSLIILGIVIGFAISFPPGPVAFEVIKRGLGRGFTTAFPLGIGAALADLVYASLFYFGALKLINDNPKVQTSIYLIGSILLIAIGVRGFLHIKKGDVHPKKISSKDMTTEIKKISEDKHPLSYHTFHFLKRVALGFTMSIFNPSSFLFFITFFPPIFTNILNSQNRDYAYLFIIGFCLGVFILFTLEATFASIFKKLLNEIIFRKICIGLNSLLILSAFYFIYRFIEMIR